METKQTGPNYPYNISQYEYMEEKCTLTVWDYAGINGDPSAILTSEGRSQLQRSKESQVAWP